MLTSILRVVQVGKTTGASNSQASPTWLPLQSIIEPSIAIIVGCGPGFYQKATSVSKSKQTPYCDVEDHNRRPSAEIWMVRRLISVQQTERAVKKS